MASKYLPDDNHVVRYVPFSKLATDEETGEILGFLYTAFEAREDEEYLSATWVEHFE